MCKLQMRLIVSAGIFATLTTANAVTAQESIRATVDAFYPESLVTAAEESRTLPLLRYSCYAVLETDGLGNPMTIFAAYTDAFTAVIRLLTRGTSGFRIAAEPSNLNLVGTDCRAEALDIDGDNRKDVKLSLIQDMTTLDWLFTYDGSELHNVTPVESSLGDLSTTLFNVDLVDLNGDGIPEVVSRMPGVPSDVVSPLQVFRWSHGALVSDPPAIAVWEFTRRAGTPQTTTFQALLPAGATGPFTLRVVNGWRDKQGRLQNTVASGTIFINGVEVVGPDAFGANVPGFERSVDLRSENEVAVRLAGTPQGKIKVILSAAGWAAPQ